MDGNPNEILKDDISLSQNNRLPDTTDSPNEEISMDNDADGDNSITARSNEEVPENMISDITGGSPVIVQSYRFQDRKG